MGNFEDLQEEVHERIGQEGYGRSIGEKVLDLTQLYDMQITSLAAQLPQLKFTEELEELESQGYDLRSEFGDLSLKRLGTQRHRLGFANRALLKIAREQFRLSDVHMLTNMPGMMGDFEKACIKSSHLILDLVLRPPKGVEICGRNPKQELPQLARLLLQANLDDTPVPFVVPSCPDTNQYVLGDGLGEIVPKGLHYCETMHEFFAERGFSAAFDMQVADVEGLDPVILANSGETTESHLAKTGETIHKARQEVSLRGHIGFIAVRSMQSAFAEVGLDYRPMQRLAVDRINVSPDRKLHKTVDGLLAERIRLGNFDRFDTETRRNLVVAELAGYAAYGAMVGGRAVILSPDARSATPAYHYSLDAPEQFSPVFYAK